MFFNHSHVLTALLVCSTVSSNLHLPHTWSLDVGSCDWESWAGNPGESATVNNEIASLLSNLLFSIRSDCSWSKQAANHSIFSIIELSYNIWFGNCISRRLELISRLKVSLNGHSMLLNLSATRILNIILNLVLHLNTSSLSALYVIWTSELNIL